MDEPLRAHTPNELRFYLMVSPCPQCGGPWEPVWPASRPAGLDPGGDRAREATVAARCKRCRTERAFRVRWDHDVPSEGEGADCINPTGKPSRIIDLGQWVSLYWLFADSPASSPAEGRRIARTAHLCLDEALKFYGADEFPPDSALFTGASLSAYREHPENYARQRLRDLQAKLPASVRHAPAEPAGDDAARPWWRFWQT
jgi:hypothetical protein